LWLRTPDEQKSAVRDSTSNTSFNAAYGFNPVNAVFDFNETLVSIYYLIPKSAHASLRVADREWRNNAVANAFRGEAEEDFLAWLKRFKADEMSDEEARDELADIIQKGSENPTTDITLRQLMFRPEPTAVMHRAILMVMVSVFEGLIASLVEAFMRENPLQASIQEKEFSLAELIAANDLNTILDTAITKRVENILRGGLPSWTKWFGDQDIAFQPLCIDWEGAVEVFERRHAYVHTGGRINPSYHHKIAGSGPVGAPLPITEQYLRSALGQIICLGNLVAARFLPKIEKGLPVLAGNGAPILYFDELMKLDQWAPVEKMSNALKNGNMELDIKLQVRCFEWLAIKKLHGFNKIEQQVRKWDTSALKQEHAFRKAALLEDFSEMRSILSAARASRESWVDSIDGSPEVLYQENVKEFVSQTMHESE
jgi:hypothetical protein